MRFDELDLEEAVLDGLDAMNFLETTPVQELTIPVILEGKDIIACAQTGTGKTAAYVLPVINELSKGLHPDTGPNDPEKPGRSQDSHLPSTRNNHANGLCLL